METQAVDVGPTVPKGVRFLYDGQHLQAEMDRFGIPAPRRVCLLYTSPSPRDVEESRMPSSA